MNNATVHYSTVPGVADIDSFKIVNTAASHHIVCTVPNVGRRVPSVGVQHENWVKLDML